MDIVDTKDLTNLEAKQTGYSKRQRAGLWFLVFLILIILAFWYLQLRVFVTRTLYGSYDPAQIAQDQLNELKRLENQNRLTSTYESDTDGDKLSDWEEINIYGTSPYLLDSDGDGLDDKTEIKSGSNPSCPEGKKCIGSMTEDQRPADASVPTPQAVGPVTQDQADIMKQAFGDNPDPVYLRAQLLSATTNEEQKQVINSMTDQQMLDFYKQLIENSANQDSSLATSSKP